MRKNIRNISKSGAVKCIALLCAVCILCTMLSFTVFAESDVTVEVTDVTNDVITISGSAPVDAVITIKILNPGVSINDAAGNLTGIGEYQFFDLVYSRGGKFSRSIKINTGEEPDKNEGVFTILVSQNGKLIYFNNNFAFYSNDTKSGYVQMLKTATKQELLEEDGDVKVLEKIFETYSLSGHELYKKANTEKYATIICDQESREELSEPADVKDFLVNVLLISAFSEGNNKVYAADEIKYSEIWAKNGDSVDVLYSEQFINSLKSEGKSGVKKDMIAADYTGAQFDDIFKIFKESMLYHLIMNNDAMGTGHIQQLVLIDYKDEYADAGFKADLLEKINKASEKTEKLNKLLDCGATNLEALAKQFNKIMAEKTNTSVQGGGGSSSGGGGPVSSSGAPSGGGGFTGGTEKPVATPAPTTSPEPATPSANYPFKDMGSAAWAEEAVEYLYKEGIVNGRSETEFVPSQAVTRAELVKMVLALIPEEEETDNSKVIKVACIGDSLTQGFVGEDGKYQTSTSYTEILQQMLGDGYEVKNFGRAAHGIYKEHEYSYTKTDEYKNSLAYEPDIVISVFGSNDMRDVYWQDIKGDYTSIYTDFIKTYTSLPSSPEVVIGLPGPVYDGEYIKSRPYENQIEAQKAILKAAEELGVKVADTYTALFKEGSEFLPDGLHFNKDGARTFASVIFEAVMKKDEAKPEIEIAFTDVPDDAWFSEAVIKAASKGVVNGYGDSFKPNEFITREDAAVIIYRALKLENKTTISFSDAENISDYAKDAISAMSAGGYINGMGDGSFAPKASLTRAQAAQLIYNAIKGGNAE